MILRRRQRIFSLSDISYEDWLHVVDDIIANSDNVEEWFYVRAQRIYSEGKEHIGELIQSIFAIFYHVGLIGVKTEPHLSWQWSFLNEPYLSAGQLRENTHMQVHSAFWAALGTRKK